MKIRTLRANEIECRVQTVKDNGCSILLYKDARCDMKILDEVFGCLGWERGHQEIGGKLFCTVKVWDNDNKQWISKQDVGVESNTEATKGEASDSFKRACFNIGIGRELYTAPFIWINTKDKNEAKFMKLTVKSIAYNDDREITGIVLVDNKGTVKYSYGSTEKQVIVKCEACGTGTTEDMANRTYKAYGKKMCKECGIKAAAK